MTFSLLSEQKLDDNGTANFAGSLFDSNDTYGIYIIGGTQFTPPTITGFTQRSNHVATEQITYYTRDVIDFGSEPAVAVSVNIGLSTGSVVVGLIKCPGSFVIAEVFDTDMAGSGATRSVTPPVMAQALTANQEVLALACNGGAGDTTPSTGDQFVAGGNTLPNPPGAATSDATYAAVSKAYPSGGNSDLGAITMPNVTFGNAAIVQAIHNGAGGGGGSENLGWRSANPVQANDGSTLTNVSNLTAWAFDNLNSANPTRLFSTTTMSTDGTGIAEIDSDLLGSLGGNFDLIIKNGTQNVVLENQTIIDLNA